MWGLTGSCESWLTERWEADGVEIYDFIPAHCCMGHSDKGKQTEALRYDWSSVADHRPGDAIIVSEAMTYPGCLHAHFMIACISTKHKERGKVRGQCGTVDVKDTQVLRARVNRSRGRRN